MGTTMGTTIAIIVLSLAVAGLFYWSNKLMKQRNDTRGQLILAKESLSSNACKCINPSKYKFEYYKSPKNGKWYFRMKAGNNKVVCSSRQGYENVQDLLETVDKIKSNAYGAKVFDVTKPE